MSARADLVDPSPARRWANEAATEYVGALHQTDRWYSSGPRGTGVLVREQAYAPTLLVSVQRRRREPINCEENHIFVLPTSPDGHAELPADLAGAPVIETVQRVREIWLLGALRVNIDTVPGAGVLLSLEAVIDDDHPESSGRAAVRWALSELGIAESALVPKTLLELVRERRATRAPLEPSAELNAIRARNREEIEVRLARLRAMAAEAPEDAGRDAEGE